MGKELGMKTHADKWKLLARSRWKCEGKSAPSRAEVVAPEEEEEEDVEEEEEGLEPEHKVSPVRSEPTQIG